METRRAEPGGFPAHCALATGESLKGALGTRRHRPACCAGFTKHWPDPYEGQSQQQRGRGQ